MGVCIFCGKNVRIPYAHEPRCPHKPDWWEGIKRTMKRHPSSGQGVVTDEEWAEFEDWVQDKRTDRGQ